MSLSFQQIILDAGKLVGEISTQENTADLLICKIQSVCSQIDSMKQYKEEVDMLNSAANQMPRQELIAGFQKNDSYFRELQAENKELRYALEDHQNALELIMTKYRQQTAYLMRQTKTDFTSLPNTKTCPNANQCKCTNIINRQADKINEMAAVMRTAVQLDEDSEMQGIETMGRLQEENKGLREIVSTYTNRCCSSTREISVENKTVQTDEL